MTTMREHLEAIRDALHRHSSDGSNTNYNHAIAALEILDQSPEVEGALQTDRYRMVIDDAGRPPGTRRRSEHHA